MSDDENKGLAEMRAKLRDPDKPFGIMTRLRVVDNEAADKLEAIMSEVVPASQLEPGNLTYQVSRDIADPLTFVLYDRWCDIDAVAAHEASEHFRKGVAQMKGLVGGKPEVLLLQFVGEPKPR